MSYVDNPFDHMPPVGSHPSLPWYHRIPVFSTMGRGPRGEKGEKGERGTSGEDTRKDFDTVATMIEDPSLEPGDICHTLGFHTSGDGGDAWYVISDTLPEGMTEANGMDVIGIPENAPTLYANLVVTEDCVTPEMFGAIGDGLFDNFEILQYIVDNYHSIKLLLKTYAISDTVVISKNNVSIIGVSSVMVTANQTVNPSCSVLKWIGETNNDKAMVLCSALQSYTPDTDFPLQGLTLKNIAFNGDSKTGFGLYISFIGYSGCIDYIYAQGCISAGVLIANAWMVKFGFISCWFNGIGIVIGKDYSGTNRSVNECTFEHLIGHSSSVSFNVIASLQEYAGTGILLKTISATFISNIDAEKNETCGVDITSSYGLSIGSIWVEYNSGNNAGIGIKNSGDTKINVVTLGVDGELIINKGNLDIGILDGIAKYYPFAGSNIMSVRIGKCSNNLYDKETIKLWTALIVDFIKWAEHDDFASNVQTTQYKVMYPHKDIACSLVIVPKNSVNASSFAVQANGGTLSIPANNWQVGTPRIMNCYASPAGYDTNYSFGVSTANSDDFRFEMIICSIRYFYNQPWTQLKELLN